MKEALALRKRLEGTPPFLAQRLLDTMGYREALLLHGGELSEAEAIEETYRRHRQYARRQRTWFQKEPWWQRFPAECPDLVERILSFHRLS